MTLPVHGFVLAGGKSSRMGRDKATLTFRGKPMAEIAVEKLRAFCEQVSIAGNRDDLARYAPVVHEERVDCGPAAGIEAGLKACEQPWALFVPVDVPLVPADILCEWVEDVLERREAGCGVSFLVVLRERQPAFCMVRKEALGAVSTALEGGARSVVEVLLAAGDDEQGWIWPVNAERFREVEESQWLRWFSNVNTPAELGETEMRAGD